MRHCFIYTISSYVYYLNKINFSFLNIRLSSIPVIINTPNNNIIDGLILFRCQCQCGLKYTLKCTHTQTAVETADLQLFCKYHFFGVCLDDALHTCSRQTCSGHVEKSRQVHMVTTNWRYMDVYIEPTFTLSDSEIHITWTLVDPQALADMDCIFWLMP